MKRVLALTLAIIMLLSLAACGGEPDVRGEQIVNGTKETTGAQVEPSTTEATAAQEEPSTTEASAAQEELSLGAVDGLTYENKFIGIGCTLDNTWTFSTEEEIKAVNSIGAELVGEEYVEAMKNATVVYDMMATKDNLTDSIQVVLEKMNAVQILALNITDNYEALIEVLKETYDNAGGSAYTGEIAKITIDGKEFDVLNVSVDLNGVAIYQTILSVKCGAYLASITFTTAGENTISNIVESFYLI